MVSEKEDMVITEVDKQLEKLFGESEESPGLGKEERRVEVSPLWDLKAIILSIDWEITDEIMTRLIEQIGRAKNAYDEDKTILLFLQLLESVGKYIKANKADTHPDAIKLLNSVYTSLEKVALSKGISNAEKEKTLLFEIKRFKKLKEHIALRKAETGKREKTPPAPSISEAVRAEMAEIGPDTLAKEIEAPFQDETATLETSLEQRPSEEELGPEILANEVDVELPPQDEGRLPIAAEDDAPEFEKSGVTPHEAFSQALLEIKQTIKAEFEALRMEIRLWRQGQ